ncbi:hypothetical protein ABQX22_17745 [Xanthomonas sp. WHRI 1810A]|jgi:hypothetical protein|uniref:hypothetical protein n=1 Tax=Xanthomonas sp. WHRI 1810A TaxID=3161565 RepID=UPI0032E924B0
MKRLLLHLSFLSVLTAPLFIGYYETMWAEDNTTVWFIKKSPTLQMEFVNIFATDADVRQLRRLDDSLRQRVARYCKYHLGIETEIKTQEALDACARAFYTLKTAS